MSLLVRSELNLISIVSILMNVFLIHAIFNKVTQHNAKTTMVVLNAFVPREPLPIALDSVSLIISVPMTHV